jgi:hypothetical protein
MVAVARGRALTVVLSIAMATLTVLVLAVTLGVLNQSGQNAAEPLPVPSATSPGDDGSAGEPPPGPDGTPTFLAPLVAACESGDLTACDDLYLQTPVGSEDESLGSTCGGRAPETFGHCLAWGEAQAGASEHGQSAALDALWDSCASDGGAACVVLWRISAEGTGYHAFAATCGGRGLDPETSCRGS